jgi:hypothetical protein
MPPRRVDESHHAIPPLGIRGCCTVSQQPYRPERVQEAEAILCGSRRRPYIGPRHVDRASSHTHPVSGRPERRGTRRRCPAWITLVLQAEVKRGRRSAFFLISPLIPPRIRLVGGDSGAPAPGQVPSRGWSAYNEGAKGPAVCPTARCRSASVGQHVADGRWRRRRQSRAYR